MKPGGGGKPSGTIAKKIDEDFGSYEDFAKEFKAAGGGQFGSGWAWLVLKDGKLGIRKTPNAETPVTEDGATPLLTMDVWEHAYYIDYRNDRGAYVDAFFDVANWDFAAEQFKAASAAQAAA
jgi:Fe-Mn family superoxide dismutase